MCHWSRAVALPSLAAFEEAPSVFVLVLSAPLGGDQGLQSWLACSLFQPCCCLLIFSSG